MLPKSPTNGRQQEESRAGFESCAAAGGVSLKALLHHVTSPEHERSWNQTKLQQHIAKWDLSVICNCGQAAIQEEAIALLLAGAIATRQCNVRAMYVQGATPSHSQATTAGDAGAMKNRASKITGLTCGMPRVEKGDKAEQARRRFTCFGWWRNSLQNALPELYSGRGRSHALREKKRCY